MAGTSGVIGGIVATMLLGYLARRANPKARQSGDRKVLYFGTPMKVLGWVFLVFGGFVAFAASQASQDQIVIALSVAGAFLLIGLALWLEFHLVRVELDAGNIYTFSPWRKKRIIPWSEITEYKYSDMNKWHLFKTKSQGYIRLSILMSGIDSFLEELDKRNISVGQPKIR